MSYAWDGRQRWAADAQDADTDDQVCETPDWGRQDEFLPGPIGRVGEKVREHDQED